MTLIVFVIIVVVRVCVCARARVRVCNVGGGEGGGVSECVCVCCKYTTQTCSCGSLQAKNTAEKQVLIHVCRTRCQTPELDLPFCIIKSRGHTGGSPCDHASVAAKMKFVTVQRAEFRSCVKVEVAVLGFPS